MSLIDMSATRGRRGVDDMLPVDRVEFSKMFIREKSMNGLSLQSARVMNPLC